MQRRENLAGTEVQTLLTPAIWETYVALVGQSGEHSLGRVSDVFTETFQSRILQHIEGDILNTPVLLTDTLPNDEEIVVLGCATFDLDSPNYAEILLNTHYQEDPADLVHTILEEVIHIHQYFRGDLFDNSLPYEQRPHEIEAKRIAEEIANFPRPDAIFKLLRLRP